MAKDADVAEEPKRPTVFTDIKKTKLALSGGREGFGGVVVLKDKAVDGNEIAKIELTTGGAFLTLSGQPRQEIKTNTGKPLLIVGDNAQFNVSKLVSSVMQFKDAAPAIRTAALAAVAGDIVGSALTSGTHDLIRTGSWQPTR